MAVRGTLLALLLALAALVAGCGDDGDVEAEPEPEPDAPTEDEDGGDDDGDEDGEGGEEAAGGDSDVEVTVEGEDGEDITVRGEEDEDGGMSAEVESDDGTVGVDAGNLPDEWPDEWPVPADDVEVGQVFTLEDDEALVIEAMFGYTDDFDATIAYVESLADEGWDIDVTDDSDEFVDRANVEVEGFGWGGEIEVIEAPNTVMNITLVQG